MLRQDPLRASARRPDRLRPGTRHLRQRHTVRRSARRHLPSPSGVATDTDLAKLLGSLDDDTALVATIALEQKYASREDSESPDSWGYLAYPHTWFTAMLDAAVGACGTSRPRFLDLGAGIGTKCLAAQRRGCLALGIEHDERLVAEAVRLGANVGRGDVREADVSHYDIVWCNSPFRDPQQEIAFETEVAEAMKPGAVLILGNKAGPAPQGWEQLTTVIERDGAWRKP